MQLTEMSGVRKPGNVGTIQKVQRFSEMESHVKSMSYFSCDLSIVDSFIVAFQLKFVQRFGPDWIYEMYLAKTLQH